MNGIIDLSASEQRFELLQRNISSLELLDEYLARIAQVNPEVNAVVTIDEESARESAVAADRRLSRGMSLQQNDLLLGLTVLIKDTEETRGMRTTFGSPLLERNVPEVDALVVERVRANGAVVLGKTNVPEFATGSHTVNPVFGMTRNPYDLSKSAGGSSGGSAAALAAKMCALATGSDMGGSLRNPAGFCNVVGLRPSAGRVPTWPTGDSWQLPLVNGPMGRTVSDVALFLAVLAGRDPRSPISLPGNGQEYLVNLETDLRGLRIGWSRTLGGLDIDPKVTETLEVNARSALEELGASVIDLEPDFTGADDSFRVLRALDFLQAFGQIEADNPEMVGDLVSQNIAAGRALTMDQVVRARKQKSEQYHRFRVLFSDIDVLAAPTTAVPAFDAELPWVREINGVAQQDYLEWMRTACRITHTGFPAMSVPAGFTTEGLPVGLQLIAPVQEELRLLQLAYGFERVRPFWKQAPQFSA